MWRNVEGSLWFIVLASFVLAGSASSTALLTAFGIAAAGATLIVVPLHFFEAWRKVRVVPNKREYVLWVGFETVCACAFLLIAIWVCS